MANIYFARSLRGGKVENYGDLYTGIVKAIKDAGHRPQFEIDHGLTTEQRMALESDQYIYCRDIAWIDRCQAMIAEVSSPSTGVGYEIAYAIHVHNMPVLCVAEKEASVSAMVTGVKTVLRYRGLSDLSGFIEAFLQDVSVVCVK